MDKKTSFKSVCNTIKSKKALRTLSLLSLICILLIGAFLVLGNHFKNNTNANKIDIQKDTQLLLDMQKLTESEPENEISKDIIEQKTFAEYEEVIPFITFLESLFTLIDPKVEISIKNKEEQILLDHFADYSIALKVDNKKELLFKVLDELYNSSFITKLVAFSMAYKVTEEDGTEKFTDANLTIRLYLK